MAVTEVALDPWLSAFLDSTDELATTAMGLEGVELQSVGNKLPSAADLKRGAFIPLTSDVNSLQLGFGAGNETCEHLAKTLLGFEPDDEIEDADLADALGEIINITAGGVKSRMIDSDSGLKLGLPVVVNGTIQPSPSLSVTVARVALDGHALWLVSIHRFS
jgi:CheY-specific phosphatase CheX